MGQAGRKWVQSRLGVRGQGCRDGLGWQSRRMDEEAGAPLSLPGFSSPRPQPHPGPIPDSHRSPSTLMPSLFLRPHSPGPGGPKTSSALGALGNSGGGCRCHGRCRPRPGGGPAARRPRPAAGAAMGRLPLCGVPARRGSAAASWGAHGIEGEPLRPRKGAGMESWEERQGSSQEGERAKGLRGRVGEGGRWAGRAQGSEGESRDVKGRHGSSPEAPATSKPHPRAPSAWAAALPTLTQTLSPSSPSGHLPSTWVSSSASPRLPSSRQSGLQPKPYSG